MKRFRVRTLFTVTLLFLSLVTLSLYSLGVGEVSIPPLEIPNILMRGDSMEYSVLRHIRIPRIILAIVIGGGLSLSGLILQGIYRNPLVEPYTMGISGGASMGITIAIVAGLHLKTILALPLAGFIGAFLTLLVVYLLSMQRGGININKMLLIGVMISFVSSSVVMFLMSIADVESVHGIVFWTMGSLNESNAVLVTGMSLLSIFALFVSYLFVVPLNALRLGEVKAKHLGVNSQIVIRVLFILTSLLTGSCIAVAGVIGFVGLIIPHLSRMMVGTDYSSLLITSFLSGGVFLLLSDLVARTVLSPNELPIGVITGIVGGLTFIVVLTNNQRKSKF